MKKLVNSFLLSTLFFSAFTQGTAPNQPPQTSSGLFNWIMLPTIGAIAGLTITWNYFWQKHPDRNHTSEIAKEVSRGNVADIAYQESIKSIEDKPKLVKFSGKQNKKRRKRINKQIKKRGQKLQELNDEQLENRRCYVGNVEQILKQMDPQNAKYEKDILDGDSYPDEQREYSNHLAKQEYKLNIPRLALGGTAGLISGLLMANYLNKK